MTSISEETSIPSQLLGSRKMLEALVIHCHRLKHKTFTPEYQGWREKLMGERLGKILFSH